MNWTPTDESALRSHGVDPTEAWRWVQAARRGPPELDVQRACRVGDGIVRLEPDSWAALEKRADDAIAAHRASAFVPASGAATRMGATGPKALVPFHEVDGTWRTAFEEHCYEARALLGPDAHVHFTIPAGTRHAFDAIDVPVHTHFSVQDPATDVPAITLDGDIYRSDGVPLLRPGGHGALVGNLQGTGGDLVFVRNIDNTVHPHHLGPILQWRKRLLGKLLELEETHGRQRPLRVCGMVPNDGEPGGGPYWVDGHPQIVEAAQIRGSQRHLMSDATHFNPVEMVCSLVDDGGRPHDLHHYVDDGAYLVVTKNHGDDVIRAVERPGLWNGSMAGWRTVFVEIPAYCFHPVKHPDDLQRAAHQPA